VPLGVAVALDALEMSGLELRVADDRLAPSVASRAVPSVGLVLGAHPAEGAAVFEIGFDLDTPRFGGQEWFRPTVLEIRAAGGHRDASDGASGTYGMFELGIASATLYSGWWDPVSSVGLFAQAGFGRAFGDGHTRPRVEARLWCKPWFGTWWGGAPSDRGYVGWNWSPGGVGVALTVGAERR
jgi:hypothetical protein